MEKIFNDELQNFHAFGITIFLGVRPGGENPRFLQISLCGLKQGTLKEMKTGDFRISQTL